MKREGRQHGTVVRSYPTPLHHQRRYVKTTVDSTSVAVVANQSKFTTGKCRKPGGLGYHFHPVCRSKGSTMKSRSVGSDREFVGCPAGTSAVDALAYLATYVDGTSADDDDDYNYDYTTDE